MKKKSTSLFKILASLALCSFVIAEDYCSSNSASYFKLYSLKNKKAEEITEKNIGNSTVGESLQFQIIFYNECNKTINDINTDKIGVTFELEVKNKVGNNDNIYKISENNGEVIINLYSTLAGKHKLIINYFQQETYYVNFIPGKPSEKSILEIDKNVITVGEIVTVYIIPYDKYENLIDAKIYENSNNLFNVSYSNLTSNDDIYAQNPQIVEIINYKLISYSIKLTQVGKITIKGKVGENLLNTRTVIVNLAEIDFYRSEVYRYNSSNKELEILKNDIIEKNYEINSIYRLYPKDKYGRKIEILNEEQLNNFKSYLNFNKQRHVYYNFKLNNEKYNERQYIEFIINDDGNKIAYKKLVSGKYDLIFIYRNEKLLYNINLDNDCPYNTPFRCLDDENGCVASQTACKCPNNYHKCNNVNYCVPKRIYCPDKGTKNQRVCPIGKVLCADLNCRDNYNDYQGYHFCFFKKRCPNQNCESSLDDCQGNIENCNYYVCNNKKCVESELDCLVSDN